MQDWKDKYFNSTTLFLSVKWKIWGGFRVYDIRVNTSPSPRPQIQTDRPMGKWVRHDPHLPDRWTGPNINLKVTNTFKNCHEWGHCKGSKSLRVLSFTVPDVFCLGTMSGQPSRMDKKCSRRELNHPALAVCACDCSLLRKARCVTPKAHDAADHRKQLRAVTSSALTQDSRCYPSKVLISYQI